MKSTRPVKEKLQTQLQDTVTVAEYVNTTTDLNTRLKTEAPKAQVIIPLIRETWGDVKSDLPKLENGTPKGETGNPQTLEEQAVRELMEAGKKVGEVREHMPVPILLRNRVPGSEMLTNELDKFKLDLELRPQDNGLDAYERVSVDDFGKGMLLGMGWVPGQGIGKTNKVVVQPITFLNRGARLGLGADPSTLPTRKQKKFIKPGEQREAPPLLRAAPDANGKSRSHMKANDRLIPVHSQRLRNGALVEIRTGSHSQLYGRLVDFKEIKDDPNGDTMCSVKLQINEEVVSVKHSELQVIDEHALPKDHPALLSSEEMRKRMKEDEAFLQAANKGLNADELKDPADKKEKDKHRKRSRSPKIDKENSSSSSSSKKSKDRSARSRSPSSGSSSSKKVKRISWVVTHIRVRVINRRLGGGKYYNLKGRVDDVTSATEFTLIMDGTGQILEGMTEKDVESALPKVGGLVKMLRGEHKGETGKLLERGSNSIAAIQLESELEVIKSSFDDIAEFVP